MRTHLEHGGGCGCIWHSCVTLLQLVTCCILTHVQYNSGVIYSNYYTSPKCTYPMYPTLKPNVYPPKSRLALGSEPPGVYLVGGYCTIFSLSHEGYILCQHFKEEMSKGRWFWANNRKLGMYVSEPMLSLLSWPLGTHVNPFLKCWHLEAHTHVLLTNILQHMPMHSWKVDILEHTSTRSWAVNCFWIHRS
jgi:hypothetical protein